MPLPETQRILEQARELGRALADHPHVRAWHEASRAVQEDSQARQLLEEYHKQVEHIRKLEAEVKPVEVADKRKLADLQAQVAGHELIKRMMAAEADYVTLLRQVNQAIAAAMGPAPQSGAAGSASPSDAKG